VSDCVPYCVVISSFTKLGQFEMAEELYKEMLGYAVQPDVIIYGVFINAFADAWSVKEAINYVNEMRKAELPGNPAIYNSLIKLYTKVGYLKEAQETYKLIQLSDEGPLYFPLIVWLIFILSELWLNKQKRYLRAWWRMKLQMSFHMQWCYVCKRKLEDWTKPFKLQHRWED